jgi:hypothetical protein
VGRVCAPGPYGPANFCVPASCDAGTSGCAFTAADGGSTLGMCCGGSCIDPYSDSLNCLQCGAVCAPGLSCTESGCAYLYSTCGPLFPCPAGDECTVAWGLCVSPHCEPDFEGQSCAYAPGLQGTCCGGVCVDTSTDPLNCRYCARSCAPGYCTFECGGTAVPQNCLQTCGAGTICAGNSCVDSLCQWAGEACLANDAGIGTCCASGACATPDNDPLNCGACGVVCPSGTTCQSGLCGGLAACGAGHAGSYCNLDAGLSYRCCPGVGCVDTSFDSANCGGCNAACPSGQSCDAGTCAS